MFWVSTSLIFITQCVLELVAYYNGTAVPGIMSLGYPAYFAVMIIIAKSLGSFALIIPQVSPRIKEWAYAGFAFDFIAAFVSMWAVAGVSGFLVLPIIALAILAISYNSYHKLH